MCVSVYGKWEHASKLRKIVFTRGQSFLYIARTYEDTFNKGVADYSRMRGGSFVTKQKKKDTGCKLRSHSAQVGEDGGGEPQNN